MRKYLEDFKQGNSEKYGHIRKKTLNKVILRNKNQ